MKHKINRTCQTALLLILGLIHGPAQSETLTTLRGISPLEVDQPLAVDSVDQKGNSFNHERLLKLKLTVPEQAAFTQPYEPIRPDCFISLQERRSHLYNFSLSMCTEKHTEK